MANKVIIGILVLLVILMGGTGYFSYNLNQHINDLGGRLTASETEQTARVDAVNDKVVTLGRETQSSIDTLGGKIGETMAEIDTLKEEIGATQNQTASLENEIGGVASQVDKLGDSFNNAVAGFSRSLIDASAVYQRVSQATVTISNGQNTVIGSGVIFDTEAHVMTAFHVVDGLAQIYALLHDGRVFKATIVGYSQSSDIAVLKLASNPSIEPPLLADSGKIQIGEPVAAIGSPLDWRDTLTSGIVSQVNRLVNYSTPANSVANLIQFDAAVNPGNSGGPLANAEGEVIGIVVARIEAGTGDGIYWAVSSNKAKRVATALIARGSFDYPWIGVSIADLTPQIVQDRSLETANGALITGVIINSPAQTAGIKVNDIIVSVDGVSIKDSAELTSYLGERKSPGDAATIELLRGTTRVKLDIEVGKRQE